MSGLVKFLLARIAEDEATAKQWPQEPAPGDGHWEAVVGDHIGVLTFEISFTRALGEVEAKRRVMTEHYDRNLPRLDDPSWMHYQPECEACSCYSDCVIDFPCPTVRALVLPYADHPDYQAEWTNA